MDEHDHFLILGTALIVALAVGMLLGSVWSSFFTSVNLSAFLI